MLPKEWKFNDFAPFVTNRVQEVKANGVGAKLCSSLALAHLENTDNQHSELTKTMFSIDERRPVCLIKLGPIML